MIDLLIALLGSTITLSAPLILAALGGFFSERSGIINIALEGKMLSAACLAAIVGLSSGSAMFGLLAGIGAAVVMSLLHYLLTQTYSVDHVVSGMAVNIIAFGGTNFLASTFMDESFAAKVPIMPVAMYDALAFLLPLLCLLYVQRSRGGLRLLALGNDPDKARQMGVSAVRVRLMALLATGVLCGLAGTLMVSTTRVFSDGMTAGRGFIALAALVISGWRPIPTLIACVAFGFFQALQINLQGIKIAGLEPPPEFWQSLPYLVTVVALAGLLGRNQAPAGLGKP
ncbi:MAG: ABC transporter permease [Fimbriimonadaceae bacterium]|nr:ABC transporter permease [Fimbriimonadaceae bacterium]